ncbi:glycerate kinase [bacterium]|nr:MAG: glycerate kinase [bacterium]
MKIVLAPDSFKGSLSAIEACNAMHRAATRVFPDASFELCPLADGGEGTLDALLAATGGYAKTVRVRGPLGESVEARWGILPDGKGVIEMAQASGLTLVPPEKRDAKAASTWGTGQLIGAALIANCREILVGLGGSATTDGGAGALSALGARFRDERDVVLRDGGAALAKLHTIDLRFFDERLKRVSFTVLSDVTNPLCGPQGSAPIYGPQKGAAPEDVEVLDAALSQFAALTHQKLGLDVSNEKGAGAAGGLGFGLMAYCHATVRSGIEAVLEVAGFEEKAEGADLVITGEGALDAQTLHGKTIAGVCRATKAPVIAFGGKVSLSQSQMQELGLQGAYAIADETRDLAYSMENAAHLLEAKVEAVLKGPR